MGRWILIASILCVTTSGPIEPPREIKISAQSLLHHHNHLREQVHKIDTHQDKCSFKIHSTTLHIKSVIVQTFKTLNRSKVRHPTKQFA